MEHRHLRFFLAVAEELHFTRAAATLNIAQPHLSQEIKRLEEEMGVALFRRTKRHVELTPAGLVFLDRVRNIFNVKDEAVRAAQRASRGETGTLNVAFATSASFDIVPRALSRFRDTHPHVEVWLEDLFSDHTIEALLDGRADVGLAHPPRNLDPSLEAETLYVERLVAVLPADHRLANRAKCHLEDLLDEPWLGGRGETATRMREEVEAALDKIGRRPPVVSLSARLAARACLIAGGYAISVMPESAARLGIDGLQFVPLEGDPIKAPFAIITRKGHTPPTMPPFLDAIRDCARDRQPARGRRKAQR